MTEVLMEDICSCGCTRDQHCLDDDCCYYAPGEIGGACFGCRGCGMFERVENNQGDANELGEHSRQRTLASVSVELNNKDNHE